TDRGANEKLAPADVPDAVVAGATYIHLSGYSFFAASPRAAVLDVMAHAGGRPVSVDPASSEFLREAGPETFLQWTQGAALLLPNADEAQVLAGSADPEVQCARLAERYPLVVIKRGALGSVAAAGARRWRVEAAQTHAVDATGAGDAFAGAFLAARLKGTEIAAALEKAVAAGAAAAAQVGGRPRAGDRRG
ncbi:MAG TPA: PfkB family carbohydrate kinase, partial [Roseiarcus sp.]|nr:PfkB family carbohydrate kinase [Roseiarcus sp.]